MSNSAVRNGFARPVYLAAATIMLAFIATIAFVIDKASSEADSFAQSAEMRLTATEFQRLADDVFREHAEISYWDDAVAAFSGGNPDRAFIDGEIVELVTEHGFDWAAVISEDGNAILALTGEQVLYAPRDLPMVRENRDLVDKAFMLYRARRVATESGYIVPAGLGVVIDGLQASGFRMWNGTPGLVVAQVILPETEEFAIAEDDASVFVAFKPVDPIPVGHRLEQMESRIIPAGRVNDPHLRIDLPNGDEMPALEYRWQPRNSRYAIIAGTVPPATVLCMLICAAMIFAVRRHGRALKALSRSEERNRIMATHDALTGLPNRTQFDEYVDRLLATKDLNPIAVMCIDLDRFKSVNDTFGHHAGDAVLRAVANRFRARIGDDGIVARVGGDEFIVAMARNVDRDRLIWLGDSLVEDALRPVCFHGHELFVGASIGIAIWPEHGETAREVISAADRLLYRSKEQGRGRATVAETVLSAPRQVAC